MAYGVRCADLDEVVAVEKTTIYLPDELRAELAAYLRRSGRRQSDVVREALGSYLRQEQDAVELPTSIGVAAEGTIDAASYEDELGAQWAAPEEPR